MQMKKISFAAFLNRIKSTEKEPLLFMGAGCSITGHIPGATEMIKEIKKDPLYLKCLKDPSSEDYFEVMNCFDSVTRRGIFNKYISKSKLNVSNFLAAQLLSDGKIRCILTTNFDDLLPRGCSFLSKPVPIYDVTLTKLGSVTNLFFPSILYLHGQMHGFWQLNTGPELRKHKKTISYFLQESIKDTPIIIVGYSGNDHISDLLSASEYFPAGLYWVPYKRQKLSPKVEKLFGNKIGTFYIDGDFDSDSFLYELAKANGAVYKFNKHFIKRTLLYINNFNTVIKSEGIEIDILDELKKKLSKILDNTEDNAVKVSKATVDYQSKKINYYDFITVLKELGNLIEDLIESQSTTSLRKKDVTPLDIYDNISKLFLQRSRDYNSPELFELTIDLCKLFLLQKETDVYFFNYMIAVAMCEWGKITRNETLLGDAQFHYKIALDNSPESSLTQAIYVCIGVSYHDIANIKHSKGADLTEVILCLNSAQISFINANKISVPNSKLQNNIASMLIDRSNITNDQTLLYHAIERAQNAEEIKSGSGAYNLACCYSLLGEIEKAFMWLEKALANRAFRREQIEQDFNLNNIKLDKRFQTWLKKYCLEY
jgi:hypothetical protein